MTYVLILSGEIATGKTTLARKMAQDVSAIVLRTRDLICKEVGAFDMGRLALQKHGEELDAQTDCTWTTPHVMAAISNANRAGTDLIVVDAMRRIEQVDALRNTLPPSVKVAHVHLRADSQQLEERYFLRGSDVDPYESVKNNITESLVNGLVRSADLVIDTSRCTVEDSVIRVRALLGLRRHNHDRLVDVLVGGQYGSEGKGHIVAHIAPEYEALVRVGGPNAGHTVLHPLTDEKVSFYHLPSGSLHNPRAKLILGPGAVINPIVLDKEVKHLGGWDALRGRLFIDPQAMLITPDDMVAETDLVKGIGSTGQGVGMATLRKIRREKDTRLADSHFSDDYLKPTRELLDEEFRNGHRVLMEGTQGTGLSLHHGHYPYVTSRDTAASGTLGEAGIGPHRVRRSIVVLRTFPIRVQSPADSTSGPMGLETSWDEVAKKAGVEADVLREREKTTTTKRQRRVSEFSWSDLDRAVSLNTPTDLALTFVDYLDPNNQHARRYEQLSDETLRFIEEIERVASTPVSLINTRCHRRSVIDRRDW